MTSNSETPELSIIVAIIAGGDTTMSACLTALSGQVNDRMECLVPYDNRLNNVNELALKFPWAQFIDARAVVDVEKFGSSSREHHDILRAIGLNQASGKIVALLEDHGTPSAEWVSATLEAHEGDSAAVGGAVENGVDRLLNWAVYYCDFGRYQNPVPEGPAEFLSDSNVTYKNEVLQTVKHLWVDAFHETSVNWELKRRGHELRLNPHMVVYQTRETLRFLPALYERYVWGRSFAGTRAAEVSGTRRLTLAALSFLLPFVLTLRIVLLGINKRRHLNKLILALPLILILETIWSFGEFVGYLTKRTGEAQPTTYAEGRTA